MKFKAGDVVALLGGAQLHFSKGTISHYDSSLKCWRVFAEGEPFPYFVDEKYLALLGVNATPTPTRKKLVDKGGHYAME